MNDATKVKIGCVGLPLLVGAALLVPGVWMMTGWGQMGWLGKLDAVVLVVLGGGVILGVVAVMILRAMLRRSLQRMGKDAMGLWESIGYMLRMGRLRR